MKKHKTNKERTLVRTTMMVLFITALLLVSSVQAVPSSTQLSNETNLQELNELQAHKNNVPITEKTIDSTDDRETSFDGSRSDDVGVVSIDAPISGLATGAYTPKATIINNGTNNLTNVPVQIQIENTSAPPFYFFDFEADNGLWIPSASWAPYIGDWEWTNTYDVSNYVYGGYPTSEKPPLTAYSGTGLWGTKIYSPYTNAGGFSYLSQTFDFSSFSDPKIQWRSWEQVFGSFDYCQLRVNGNLVWGPSWDYSNPEWRLRSVNLTAYAGLSSVEIKFEMYATTVVNYAGWYIDDVMIGDIARGTLNGRDLEYNHTALVNINAGETIQVEFPTWNPVAWQTQEDVTIHYNISVETQLTNDTNPDNDYLQKVVSLHYGPFHDIALTSIVNPVSGNAGVITPEVVVQNLGQYDETNVPIHMVISKPYFMQDFVSTTFPPAGWTQEQTNEWRRVTTANAGGKSPEARLYYSYITGNYAYLQSPAVDTTGDTDLWLEFRSYIDTNYGGANQKVLVRSSNASNWTDITPWSNPVNVDIPKAKYTIDISNYTGAGTQVRFEFSGTSAGLYYWYLDDVILYQLSTADYENTQYIAIDSGVEQHVIFPAWTPSDLGTAENVSFFYSALAESQLASDNKTSNNLKTQDFTLYYSFIHDVAIEQIISPESGPAQVSPVTVAVANNGQNDESVFVNVVIEKFNGTAEDFEASNGGYIPGGTATVPWEWGTPTTGPGGAHSGSKLWATGLTANYAAGLLTLDKAVTLPAGSVSLMFYHWYDTEASYDGGNVKISTDNGTTWTILIPDGGYTGTANTAHPFPTAEPIFTGHVQKYWEKETFNLNAYAGQSVIVRWDFGADSSVFYPGWYIDDVLFADPSAFISEYDQTVSVDVDIGETVNVTLPTWTPSDMTLSVNIEYRVTATATIAGWADFVSENFSNYVAGYYNFPTGWTTQTTNPTGAWYMYSSGTSIYPRVQESGSDGNAQDEWLISTAVDCSALTYVETTFKKYYYESTTTGDTYVEVLGSINGGASWPYLITTYASSSTSTTPVTFDITAWAAGQANVKIAFRFISTNDTGLSDYLYIDDFFVGTPWGPLGNNPPAGWTILDYGSLPGTWNNNDWHKYYTSTSYNAIQMNIARVYYSPSPYESMDEWLITPVLNCAALTTVNLDLWQYYYQYSTNPGFGWIDGSIDGGATWTQSIAAYSTVTQAAGYYTFDISSWAAGQSNVKIRFRYNSTLPSQGRYWYVDSVKVGDGTTTILNEQFEGVGYWTHFADNYVPASWGPLGWTADSVHWSAVTTTYAGGTAPELRFYYSPSFTGISRFYTAPIDTSAYTQLGLQFKHFVNHYTTPYTLKAETSIDGGAHWNTIWEISPTGDVGPEIVNMMLDASDGIGSTTFQLAFTFDGYSFNIDYWYIDDVKLRSVAITPDGNPGDNSVQKWITLTYAHDVGVSLIAEPIGPHDTQTKTWSGGTTNNAISDGGYRFETAIRFNVTDLSAYNNWTINTVQFFKGYGTTAVPACSGNVNIYSSTNPAGTDTLITTQPWSAGVGSMWVDVILSSPVKILPGLDYWVAVEYNAGYTSYPAGCDAGPAIDTKGDWLRDDVDPWTEMQVWGLDYNWNINAVLISPVLTEWPPGTYPVKAVINNFGFTYSETGFDVNAMLFNDTNAVVYNETITVTDVLAPGQFVVKSFPSFTIENLTAWEGDYKLEIKTLLVGDDQPSNDKKTKTFTIKILDVMPPITEHTLTGTMGNDDWYRSDVTITLTAIDPYPPFRFMVNRGPSGVNYTMIKIDDGDYELYVTPVQVTDDGEHQFWYYSVDNAGNIEEEKGPFNFKIDKTGPVFASYTAEAQNVLKNKWLFTADVSDEHSGVVLVEFYVDDALVGNATEPTSEGVYEFLYNGKGATSQAIAYDAAGNSKMSDVITAVEYIPNSQTYYPRIV